jgi:hypothetical protein
LLVTLLTAGVFFVGIAVHALVGFGFAQVSMGLLPFIRDPGPASVIFSMVAVVSNARVLWSVRDSFRWRDWAGPAVGLAAGMPIGIYFFNQLETSQLRLAIGLTLLLAVVLMMAMRLTPTVRQWIEDSDFRPGWPTAVTAGFLAGILGGAVAIPGPPMIIYGTFMAASNLWTGHRMKATFTAFFGTLMLYRVGSLLAAGKITAGLAVEAAVSLPALFLGAWLGLVIYDHIPQKTFRWVIIGMLTINALVLIFSA